MEGRLLLNIVIRKGTTVLQLLASKDQTLLVRRDAFLILDLLLDLIDGVPRLDLESDGFASEGLDENLHTSTEAENEVESRLFLDVVVGQSATVLKLLTSEDQTLLIRRDAFLILDLLLDLIDGVSRLDLKSDRLAGEGLNENLHVDDIK
jgi:hypothetical protein